MPFANKIVGIVTTHTCTLHTIGSGTLDACKTDQDTLIEQSP